MRPHRAHVAGGRGGRRERRVLLPLRRDGRLRASAFSDDDATRARQARAPGGDRARASSPRCPAARWPPTSPTARPTSRSTSARTCRRCRSTRRERIVALMRSRGLTAKVSSIHVNGWFGGYDKLGHDAALLFASASASTWTRASAALRLRRRLAERRADVRVLPALGRRRQRAPLRRRSLRAGRSTSRGRAPAPASPSWRRACCAARLMEWWLAYLAIGAARSASSPACSASAAA